MRDVMMDGHTQARVSLVDVARMSGTVGIGALEGLQGEIAIVDGVPWVARVEGDKLECTRGARSGDRATLLAISRVDRWKTIAIDRDLSPAELDALLASTQRDLGLGQRPWPFLVEGDLADVQAHVLNGQCPYAGAVEAEHEPIRRTFESVRARLVGFYAPNSVGELVHHGQSTHMHVIVEEPEVFVGHVDSASVRGGAWLRVPAVD
jgi:alpha-acetolactate decarboxylase